MTTGFHCPICRAELTIETICANEAQAELFRTILNQPINIRQLLLRYSRLWEKKRKLTPEKMTQIIKETLTLTESVEILQTSLESTLSNLEGSGKKSLENSNYLRTVIANKTVHNGRIQQTTESSIIPAQSSNVVRLTSKAGQAISTLEGMKK